MRQAPPRRRIPPRGGRRHPGCIRTTERSLGMGYRDRGRCATTPIAVFSCVFGRSAVATCEGASGTWLATTVTTHKRQPRGARGCEATECRTARPPPPYRARAPSTVALRTVALNADAAVDRGAAAATFNTARVADVRVRGSPAPVCTRATAWMVRTAHRPAITFYCCCSRACAPYDSMKLISLLLLLVAGTTHGGNPASRIPGATRRFPISGVPRAGVPRAAHCTGNTGGGVAVDAVDGKMQLFRRTLPRP
jgi:hypothetical protein